MNTPKIRFKGFKDDWEQRKVGDQMYIKSRIGWQALTKQEYLSEGDYYLITGTDIDETTHRVDLKRSYYVSKERYEMDSKIQVKEGDIIVTKDGTIGKVAMVTGLDKPATLNSHLFVLRDMSGKLDNHFLLHILNSHMFNHFVKSTKTGSTLTGLPQKTFVEFAFSCPKYEEQKLLSNYFDRLDHLITLHQRKCDETKQLKKFMLQKMFPKNGEKNPEIRFEGFTDDWEQRKFSDCYKMSSGYAFKMSDYCDEGVGLINGESIQHGIINDDNLNHLPEFFIQQYPEFLLKENDIVVGLNRPITNGNLKIARIPSKYNDSLLYQRAGKIVYKTDCDKDFTYVLLSQEILKHTLVEAVGSDQPFISTSKLDGWKMMMPSNMEEQVKIGEYFQNLDDLITLHQRKCEKLKELKKFMLQNMFV